MIRLLFFFLISTSLSYGQQLMEGTIVDESTGKPVPFASISVEGTTQGTSANKFGQFSLSVKQPFTLRVTCIGYETKVISSMQFFSRIALTPAATQLEDVIVTNKPIHPDRIVEKAFTHLPKNYAVRSFLQKFFYRHYCKDDNEYGRLIEAYVDVWKTQGYRSFRTSAGDNEAIRVTQLRRSLDKTRMAQGHEPIAIKSILETDLMGYQTTLPANGSLFFANVSSLKPELGRYSFGLEGINTLDGQEVYEISYLLKDTVRTGLGSYRVRSQIKGTLYITTKNYALVKREELKSYGADSVRTATFYRLYGDRYYPYHFVIDGKNNVPNNGEHEFHIELMSVEISQNEANKFSAPMPGKEELLHIPYDSAFWSSNTLLKTTSLEDDIIHDLGGGESLSKQFVRYQQYQLNVRDGGVDGERKFKWLCEDSKNTRSLYVVFWSANFKNYLPELEHVKQLQKTYGGKISFVFVSLDNDDVRWQETVKRYNFSANGIINYRVGSNSDTVNALGISQTPAFAILPSNSESFDLNVKAPSDPLLLKDLDLLIEQL